MLRRAVLIFLAIASLIFLIGAQQQRSKRSRKSGQSGHRSRHKPAQPALTSFVTDSGGRDLIVRLLDVGQGDATYIRNGSSRAIIDGGPDPVTFGRFLDSVDLNNS